MKVIVYQGPTAVCVLTPIDCGLSLHEIARKDVPAGVPYKIIDRDMLPSDRRWRDAWTIGKFEPDGVGEKQ